MRIENRRRLAPRLFGNTAALRASVPLGDSAKTVTAANSTAIILALAHKICKALRMRFSVTGRSGSFNQLSWMGSRKSFGGPGLSLGERVRSKATLGLSEPV